MSWPVDISHAHAVLRLPGPGWFALDAALDETSLDELLAGARLQLGPEAVGWVPAAGGLLSNLSAWENVLLATQWHAPASLPALEARMRSWCLRCGYDEPGVVRLLAQQPAQLSGDELRLLGWLRQLLARPRLLLFEGRAVPAGAVGRALRALLAEELAGSVLLVVDGEVPEGFTPLSFSAAEAELP